MAGARSSLTCCIFLFYTGYSLSLLFAEYGTYKTVKARTSQGQVLALAFRSRSFKPFRLFPCRSEATACSRAAYSSSAQVTLSLVFARALFWFKVDGLVPQTWRDNLRMVSEPD